MDLLSFITSSTSTSCFAIKKKKSASKIREKTIIARKVFLDNGGNKKDQENEPATTIELFLFLSSTFDVIGTTATFLVGSGTAWGILLNTSGYRRVLPSYILCLLIINLIVCKIKFTQTLQLHILKYSFNFNFEQKYV